MEENLNKVSTIGENELREGKTTPILIEDKERIDYHMQSNIFLAYNFLEKALQKVRKQYDEAPTDELKEVLENVLVDFISPAAVISNVLYSMAHYDKDQESMDIMLRHQSELDRIDPRTDSETIQSIKHH